MDDTAYRQYFTQPTQTYHRRYEALRAIFVEGRTQKDVAQEFGFTYGSMRQLVLDFRQYCDSEGEASESPFFETSKPADRPSMKTRSYDQRLPIGENWFCPVTNRCVSGQEPQACSCSCRC
jgi:hypothetical protein